MGGLSVADVVLRTPRLVTRAWKTLLPVAILGTALTRVLVWAIFDLRHYTLFAMPVTTYPQWSIADAARSYALEFLDLAIGAALVWIAHAVMRGEKQRSALPRVARSLPALAVLAALLTFLWEIFVNIVKSRPGLYGEPKIALMLGAVLVWLVFYVYINIRLWVVVPAIVVERLGFAALRRSWTLTQGHVLRILPIAIVLAAAANLPRWGFVLLSAAVNIRPSISPFTPYAVTVILLEAIGLAATAACVVVVHSSLTGSDDEIALDTFL